MPSPSIFLSAASIDLESLRETLHDTFSRAGFQVYTQNHSLGAAPGDVRDLLIRHIEQCDCVVHLAGMGYGKDAQDPFPEDPSFVCSWTQFEYYHAHAIDKGVIAIVLAPDLSKAGFQEAGDASEQQRKADLQAAHRERVMRGVFDGTPLAGARQRTSNEQVNSMEKLVEWVGAAVGTLHQHDPAWNKLSRELERLHREIAQLKGTSNEHGEKTTAATFRIKWPRATSYFKVGGRQTIRWEAFVSPDFRIKRYELRLYFEDTPIRLIGVVEGQEAIGCGSFTWDDSSDLQVGDAYRIRLVARDDAGRFAEGFSSPFRMRKVDLTCGDEGWGKILLLYSAFGGGAGLIFGMRVLGPRFYEWVQKDFFGGDCISQMFKFVFLSPHRVGWQAIFGIASAEFCASLVAIAAIASLTCAPARFLFLIVIAVGAAAGYAVEAAQTGRWNQSEWGAFPGGVLGAYVGIVAVKFFYRDDEDIDYVLQANLKSWQAIGRYIRASWRWVIGKLFRR